MQGDNSQEMMVILKLSDKLLIQQVYNINYKSYAASLIAYSCLFLKSGIGREWKVLPLFTFKDSMHVSGVVLYEGRYGNWK